MKKKEKKLYYEQVCKILIFCFKASVVMSDLVYSFRRIHMKFWLEKMWGPFVDFPGGTVVKNLPASAGDAGDSSSILESGGSPEGGNGNSLQYSCLENPWTAEPGRL